jgi:hypothetical protein
MKYEKTITYTGDPGTAINIVKNTFLPNGYQIIKTSENSITLEGNNLFWLQQQNNPLTGISQISIHIENSTISLKAELKTINKIILFLIIFLIGLAVLLAGIFALVFSKIEDKHNIIFIILMSFAPWPVLLPLIYFFLKARTCKALDILLSNIAAQQS